MKTPDEVACPIAVNVQTTFDIELSGAAQVKDTKIVINQTDQEQRLAGPFRQNIRAGAKNIAVVDADGNPLTTRSTMNPETNTIELYFEPQGVTSDFVVPPRGQRQFTVKYDLPGYAERLGDTLLVRAHMGNVVYDTATFDRYTYTNTFRFKLRSGGSYLSGLFSSYDVLPLRQPKSKRREPGAIVVETEGLLVRKESHTDIILLVPKWRKGLTVIVTLIVGTGVHVVIEHFWKSLF